MRSALYQHKLHVMLPLHVPGHPHDPRCALEQPVPGSMAYPQARVLRRTGLVGLDLEGQKTESQAGTE